MTAGTAERAAGRPRQLSAEALALWEKFPPRLVPASWPATRQPRDKVLARLLAPPFLADGSQSRCTRRLALLRVLDWLELHPGTSWQERWNATGAGADGRRDWRRILISELTAAGSMWPQGERIVRILGQDMIQLIGADVIRPSLGWLMATSTPQQVAGEMARARDPAGLARLHAFREAGTVGEVSAAAAIEKAAAIMAAKGGLVSGITVGDCLELVKTTREVLPGSPRTARHSPFFYQMLHAAGVFPAGAPPTVRMFSSRFAGQLTAEQMIDRYDLACRPGSAGGLPARAAARHRLRHAGQPGDRAGPVVLEGPGEPPPGHQLAAPAA